jgi:hypothetical protein
MNDYFFILLYISVTITDITTITIKGIIIRIPIARIMSDMREMFLILYMWISFMR